MITMAIRIIHCIEIVLVVMIMMIVMMAEYDSVYDNALNEIWWHSGEDDNDSDTQQ